MTPDYNPAGSHAGEFINHGEILSSLEDATKDARNNRIVNDILRQAAEGKGLTHRQAAVLLECESQEVRKRVFSIARELKHRLLPPRKGRREIYDGSQGTWNRKLLRP